MMTQVRAYNLKHGYGSRASSFLEACRRLLQNAIDLIWNEVEWREEKNSGKFRGRGKRKDAVRLIPKLPLGGAFKHHTLRNELMRGWSYSKHYVDGAIKQAYSILNSWRRNYVKGFRSREKPIVKRRFARVKETLYSCRDGLLRVSIKPYENYLVFDLRKAWFYSRIKSGILGELILSERFLTVTVRHRKSMFEENTCVAWDSNEASIDGFSKETGWIKADLSQVYHIHRVYEIKRRRLQALASRKSSLRRKLSKYSRRERNRVKDELHKITSILSEQPFQHQFEALDKNGMYNLSRRHNAKVSKADWRVFKTFLAYKSAVGKDLNPYNSTRRCARCGGINKAPNGALFVCVKCGLRMDRQLNAAINLYLQMEGLSPSIKLFQELMSGWSGFDLTGREGDEPAYELVRPAILVNSKGYIPCQKVCNSEPHPAWSSLG